MHRLIIFTSIITGIATLAFYSVINYLMFGDFGFVAAGRIVFASKYGYFDYLILPLGILAGMLWYRNSRTENMVFKNLFNFGWQITLVSSVLFSAFIFTYLQYIDPGYFDKLISLIKQINTEGKVLSANSLQMLESAKSMEENALFRSPIFYALVNLIVYLALGFLGSLIFASALKKKWMIY